MNLPLIVENRLRDFSINEKDAFYEEFNRKKKSVITAYFCLILLGWHYAYLKKWGLQALCLVTLWGLLLWWIVDWFRVPALVREYNKDLSVELLNNFSWVSKKEVSKDTSSASTKMSEWMKENPNSTINDYYRSNKL